ncbi:BlaI/MecI/CopY family transcriptional regulator [Brevundimonas sp.]|uniref:BlaI/MecI/CopY family transcriptional regulator n=1 Tax=Brevundimonas sp. TaxID=1871086 RepID=UPI002897CB09|nr:BlaI/MecI/CopY family transcriptional regulator [Brevundimonas sp.]
MTIPVTEAESELLAALWRRGPLPAKRLIEEVRSTQDWGDATIKTLLGRLMRKGAILSERVDDRQQYRALISRNDYVRAEISSLARRLFGGDQKALIAALED